MRFHLAAAPLVALALCLALPAVSQAQKTPQLIGLGQSRVGLVQRTHEVGINVFRNPSIGLELREGPVSVHVGAYPTIISDDARGDHATTWFLKAGATFFFLPHILYGREVNELYVQAAYMRGLHRDWEHAFIADIGYRFMIYRGLNVRLGVAVIAGPGHTPRVNPTPGAGWSYAW